MGTAGDYFLFFFLIIAYDTWAGLGISLPALCVIFVGLRHRLSINLPFAMCDVSDVEGTPPTGVGGKPCS